MYSHLSTEFSHSYIVKTGIVILFTIFLLVHGTSASNNSTWITVDCQPWDGEESWFWINGTLLNSANEPVAGKEIRLICSPSLTMDPDTSIQYTIPTDDNGRFSFFTLLNQTTPYREIWFDGDKDYLSCSIPLSCENQLKESENAEPSEKSNDFSFSTHAYPDASTTGFIMAASEPPGAEIYIDNILHGVTPTLLANISCGVHDICFTMPGYKNMTMGTYVTAGKTSHIQSSLNPVGSQFSSEPSFSSAEYPFDTVDSNSYLVIRQGDVSLYTRENGTWINNAASGTDVPGSLATSIITGSNATGFITTIMSTGDSMKKSTITFGKPHQ